MRLPRKLWVGDVEYTVKFVRKIPDPDPKCIGLCCSSEQVIYILQGLSPKERLETFVHELLHAFEFEYEIAIPHQLIYALEKPVVNFLVENIFTSEEQVESNYKSAG